MQICEKYQMKKKTLSGWMVGRCERGPCQKPKAWGGRERWWLVGVAGVANLSSWCGPSPVQGVVISGTEPGNFLGGGQPKFFLTVL
jgi:hypothetical protein